MIARKSFSALRLIIYFLLISLLGTFGFSYKIYEDAKETQLLLTSQKNALLLDLTKSKDSLEIAISENSSLKTELIIERQKVTNLLNEISANENVDVTGLLKYRKEVNDLKVIIASLTKERNDLKRKNNLLKEQRDSTILVLTNAKKYSKELKELNLDLDQTVKKGSAITVVNLKTNTYKQTKRGSLEQTNKARKVNLLQISFIVVGSKISKPCIKEFYVQIIDSKNNIVGERIVKKFGSMLLEYSCLAVVKFKNESLEVYADLIVENLEKGTYWVNVFDNGNLASKTIFELK